MRSKSPEPSTMANIIAERMTATIDDEVIVFLIGMRFNRLVAPNGDVGIWHETYRVRRGDFECIYNNMPLFGLAKATQCIPASGRRESASGRMGVHASVVT